VLFFSPIMRSSTAHALAARLARSLSGTTAGCSSEGGGVALRRTATITRRRFSTTTPPPLPPPADAASTARARGPVSWLSLALTAATGAGLVFYYDHLKAKKVQGLTAAGVATAGAAAIGGPFAGLVVGPGGDRPFSSDDLCGHGWHLLYFGFTHCPDVCPDELEKVAAVVDRLAAGDKRRPALTLTPVFVSLDPARDTPAQVGAYVKEFHPSMVGVTGPLEAVQAAARAYRVYHAKAPTGPEPNDYLIDHSIITYLVAPDGGFVTFFGKQVGVEAMAEAVWERAAEWEAGGGEE
jgi:protein SCO1/2